MPFTTDEDGADRWVFSQPDDCDHLGRVNHEGHGCGVVTACPPSDVVDLIVSWADGDGTPNVQPGDLIVWHGDFSLVLTIEPHPSGTGVMVLTDGGMPWPTYCRGDDLVAVRRYVTEED